MILSIYLISVICNILTLGNQMVFNTFFDSTSGTKCTKSEHISVFGFASLSGLDESRTRVRRLIPCPSTRVVYPLTFPPPPGDKHPDGFSSFMIRPLTQSFANVVSHIVEAWILMCECTRSDCCN